MTTFKPGMHQLVETRQVDFDAIIAKMAGVQPQVTFPMMGWGKKFYIQATLKRKSGAKVVVEFYTEVTFPEAPSNKGTGYTKDDATIFQGVSILDYEAEADPDGYHKSQGEVMSYDDFVAAYITDDTTRITLGRVMEDMFEKMAVNDQTIDRINTAWENREPGNKTLYDVQYQ